MSQSVESTLSAGAVAFLQRILPIGQLYCASSVIPGNPKSWTDEIQHSIQAIVDRNFQLSNNGYNTYYALSSFHQGWHQITTPDGQLKNVYRTQNNSVQQKALWLDIDCGKNDKQYANEPAAIEALLYFLQNTQLPEPMVVYSGSGLHCYWTMTEAVATQQWLIMSGMLKALTRFFSLQVDHSRTCDPASVLRLPGTMNYGKMGDKRLPVTVQYASQDYTPIELAQRLLTAVTENNVPINQQPKSSTTLRVGANPHSMDVLSAMHFPVIEDNYTNIKRHPYRIIKECKQIQQGGTGTRTQWLHMLSVMRHCAFGELAMHDISAMDNQPGGLYRYKPEDVDLTLATLHHGPTLCTTFNDHDSDICPSCPYWGKIKTPLLLGEPYVEEKPIEMPQPVINLQSGIAVVTPDTPLTDVVPYTSKDFSVIPGTGIVWHKRELVAGGPQEGDEDSQFFTVKNITINTNEIYLLSICIDDTVPRNLQRSYVVRKKAQGLAPVDILYNVESDMGTQQCRRWLAHHGMLPVHPKFDKQMSDFMSAYIAKLQNRLKETQVRDTMGWVDISNKITGEKYDAFILGKKMYSQYGVSEASLNERCEQVAMQFKEKGTLEEWKKLPLMYSQLNQMDAQLFICAAFAAPFMKFGNGTATNAMFSMWDTQGGKGKSSLLQVINSIWGDPHGLMMTKNDTPSGRFQMLSVRKNLCCAMDEMTQQRDDEMATLLYDIANGREKIKSAASGTQLAKTGSWQTVTFFTSNKSLYEMMQRYQSQSTATSMRVLEVQCDFPDYAGTPTGQYIEETLALLKTNYGVVGRTFIQKCFENPEVFHRLPEDAIMWDKESRKYSDERFWTYALGIALGAGRLAKSFGLLPFDMDALDYYARTGLLPSLRSKIRVDSAIGNNALTDYLQESLHATLVVASAKRPPESHDAGTQAGIDTYVKHWPTRELEARLEQKEGWLFVSSKAFSRWHNRNNMSLETTLQALIKTGVFHPEDKFQYALGTGVSVVNRGRTTVYRFNANLLGQIPSELQAV